MVFADGRYLRINLIHLADDFVRHPRRGNFENRIPHRKKPSVKAGTCFGRGFFCPLAGIKRFSKIVQKQKPVFVHDPQYSAGSTVKYAGMNSQSRHITVDFSKNEVRTVRFVPYRKRETAQVCTISSTKAHHFRQTPPMPRVVLIPTPP